MYYGKRQSSEDTSRPVMSGFLIDHAFDHAEECVGVELRADGGVQLVGD
jgi:hypothetical protein